jgi:hypothetical protein
MKREIADFLKEEVKKLQAKRLAIIQSLQMRDHLFADEIVTAGKQLEHIQQTIWQFEAMISLGQLNGTE